MRQIILIFFMILATFASTGCESNLQEETYSIVYEMPG